MIDWGLCMRGHCRQDVLQLLVATVLYLLQAMDEWLKEYTAKLAEANGISMDGHAENGGGKRCMSNACNLVACISAHVRLDSLGVHGCHPAPGGAWPGVTELVRTPGADAAQGEGQAQPAKQQRRLWLHADMKSSPGAFGFYRTAHREPMGECLRLLIDNDLPDAIPPVNGLPQTPESARSLPLSLRVRSLQSSAWTWATPV